MRSVKEVAELTGISVRTLQYYDEIGVFKPTKVTDAGYRYYDDASLELLQQILFFKELDFSLKDIKMIVENPHFQKADAWKKQKELLTVKRDRLNKLLHLLEKLEQGEMTISFKEFELTSYFQELDKFRIENIEEIRKLWGSVEAFDETIHHMKKNESEIKKLAVAYYGSVDEYVKVLKDNLSHYQENMEKLDKIRNSDAVRKNKELKDQLFFDINKKVDSVEVQSLIKAMMELVNEEDRLNMDLGKHYWQSLIDSYLYNETMIRDLDKQYGAGASHFMGEALQYYIEHLDTPS